MSELEIYETEPLTIGEQEIIDDEEEDDIDRSDEYHALTSNHEQEKKSV